jgi:adenylate cyclase
MTDASTLTAEVEALLARGDVLGAHDCLSRAESLDDPRLHYLHVLTVARLGDTTRATWLFNAHHLEKSSDFTVIALRARLYKDAAFHAGEDVAPDSAAVAAASELYAKLAQETGEAQAAINAATMARIAGFREASDRFAREAIQALETSGGGYSALETLSEAHLLLGNFAAAKDALRKAVACGDADIGARSATMLQLQRLGRVLGEAAVADLLALVRPPPNANYCGHIFVSDPEVEASLRDSVGAAILREAPGAAFGSLAAGSDILIAEEMLAHGVELHVVLPVAEPDFLANSVAAVGAEWVPRYHACLSRATSITHASNMSYVRDPAQYAYATQVAMGISRLHARYRGARAVQIAISEIGGGRSLTRQHIEAWQAAGGRSAVIEVTRLERPSRRKEPSTPETPRGVFGLLFADFPGFSKLDERKLPAFWDEVMARAAVVLNKYREAVEYRNTWGDALYIVFRDLVAAADAALDLRASFAEVNTLALGLPPGAAMRIGLHCGAIYLGNDPVTERMNYYGSEVARAARIEPVTPAGQVYVSEPFAALLELRQPERLRCNYVGRVPLAKAYGEHPLYRLERADGGKLAPR